MMPKRLAPDDAYFWAGGKKIPLFDSNTLAIDLNVAEIAGVKEAFQHGARNVGRGLIFIDETSLSAQAWKRLDTVGAIHPVYRTADESELVVFPEVRVEVDSIESEEQVEALVKRSGFGIVVESTKGRITIRPNSGRGEDALRIANRVFEQLHPNLSQARFMRIVPRPGRL
jgi:hypothetical protein